MVIDTSIEPNQDLNSARGDIDALFAGIVGVTVESLGEAPYEPSAAEIALGAMVSTEAHTRLHNRHRGGRPNSLLGSEEVKNPEVVNAANLSDIMRLTATAVLKARLDATDEQFTLAA